MTVVRGTIVHASDEFSTLNPPLPPVSPDWSPIKYYGTYGQNKVIVDQYNLQLSDITHHYKRFNNCSVCAEKL